MPPKKGQSTLVDLNTLDLLPIAVAIFDNKKVYFVNKKAKQLFHISDKQNKKIKNISIFELLDEKYHARIRKNNLKIIKGEEFPPVELQFKTFKNKPIYIEAKSNCVLFENKKVVQTTFIEISELKQKQFELEESEKLLIETKEKFDLITKSSNDIIAFYSYYPDEKYSYVSPNITNILGFQPKEFLSDHNFFNKRIIGSKSDFLNIDKIVRNYQKKNVKKNYSYKFKTFKKNKEEVWLENNLTPICNKQGKIVFFLNIIRDITIQKEKELELEQQQLNYQNLLDNSPNAYIIHKQGVTMFCNKTMLKLLKVKSEKQVLGRFALDFLAEFERKKALERIKDIYKGIDINKPNNYTVIDAKGNKIDAELKSILIKFDNQTCILTLINNITEQKKIESEKIKAERIKVKNEILLLEVKERQETEKKLLEKTAHLSSIFESSNHLIWTVNKNFEITSCNKNFEQILSQKYNITKIVGVNVGKVLNKTYADYMQYWLPLYKQAFLGKKLEFEKEDENLGERIYRKVFINPILNNNKIEEISCIAHDITEQKKYEEKLINQSAKLLSVFESGSQLIWTFNKEFKLTSYNQNYFKLIKDIVKNKSTIYLKDTIRKSENLAFWSNKFNSAFKGEKQVFIHKSIVNGKEFYREIFLNPISSANEVVEVSAIANDMTERIKNENKIIQQSAKLNSIIESSHHYIWTIDREERLTSFNKNYFELVSALYNTMPFLGFKLDRGALANNQEYSGLLSYHYNKAFEGIATNFEIETLDKNLKKVYLDVYLNPIFENEQILEVSGIAHNITDKKLNQQRVEQSLKEKDVLLKEVHHRVKNNMQIISSILNLQSSYVTDAYTLALLKESQNRIKTMAYIHESLYQNKSFTSVNFSEYIQTLSKNIIQSYVISSEKIELILNLEKISLNLDVSIPAGLIVNELITNAIKHAFPNSIKGKIYLNLRSENNTVYLEVKDNGIGIPPGVDFNNTNTLGLQLVNTLVDQLGAEIKFNSQKDKGTEVLIKFKM